MGLIAEEVIRKMGHHYSELIENKPFILKVLEVEETKFSSTLQQGNTLLKTLIKDRNLIQEKFDQINKNLIKIISKENFKDKELFDLFEKSKIGPESLISNLINKAIDLEKHIAKEKNDQLKLLIKNITKLNWKNNISGFEIAYLYDTLGFPAEVTSEIAEESNLKIDLDEFNNIMEKLKLRAKSSSQFKGDLSLQRLFEEMGIFFN